MPVKLPLRLPWTLCEEVKLEMFTEKIYEKPLKSSKEYRTKRTLGQILWKSCASPAFHLCCCWCINSKTYWCRDYEFNIASLALCSLCGRLIDSRCLSLEIPYDPTVNITFPTTCCSIIKRSDNKRNRTQNNSVFIRIAQHFSHTNRTHCKCSVLKMDPEIQSILYANWQLTFSYPNYRCFFLFYFYISYN